MKELVHVPRAGQRLRVRLLVYWQTSGAIAWDVESSKISYDAFSESKEEAQDLSLC